MSLIGHLRQHLRFMAVRVARPRGLPATFIHELLHTVTPSLVLASTTSTSSSTSASASATSTGLLDQIQQAVIQLGGVAANAYMEN